MVATSINGNEFAADVSMHANGKLNAFKTTRGLGSIISAIFLTLALTFFVSSQCKGATTCDSLLRAQQNYTPFQLSDFHVGKDITPRLTTGKLEHEIFNHIFLSYEVNGSGYLSFSVYLQNKMSAQNGMTPRYRGYELFDYMMQDLAARGVEIVEIHATWITYGRGVKTNFTQFDQALRNGLSPEEAALQTWTGIQARRYGFEKADSIDITDRVVTVRFLKTK